MDRPGPRRRALLRAHGRRRYGRGRRRLAQPGHEEGVQGGGLRRAGVRQLPHREEPLIRVTAEERTVEGYFAVFGNSSNYGGGFGITPLADMRDGLLDVCVLKDKSFLSTIWYWTAALINAHISTPRSSTSAPRRPRSSRSTKAQEVLVQTDGEMAGQLPLTCRVLP